jgi:GT2 family glycosyltransferase
MNPDTVAHPSMLEELTAAAASHPRGLLSPAVCYADRPDVLDTYVGDVVWWRGRSSARYLGSLVGTGPLRDEAVETASGCCLFVPAEVIRDIGLFDEAYFLYFEDMDYLERARQAQYEVWYVPAARVLHREGSATGGGTSPLALYYYIRNRHYFVQKFRHGTVVHALFIAYSTIDVAARALRFLVGRRLDVARAVMRGAVHGWRGQMGQDPGSRAKETGAYRV